MKKLNALFFKLAEVTLVIMLSAMVIMVFGNVVLRYGFNDGIISSEEISRFLFIWITFLGAIVTFRDNGHLGLDSVVRKLSTRGKKLAFTLSNVLMLGCCTLMFYGTLKQHGSLENLIMTCGDALGITPSAYCRRSVSNV